MIHRVNRPFSSRVPVEVNFSDFFFPFLITSHLNLILSFLAHVFIFSKPLNITSSFNVLLQINPRIIALPLIGYPWGSIHLVSNNMNLVCLTAYISINKYKFLKACGAIQSAKSLPAVFLLYNYYSSV